MNFKVIGAMIIIFACGGCGFLTAAHHNANIRFLQSLILGLDFMVCELQYRATPLPQLCRQTGERCNEKVGQIFMELADELESQISPNVGICMTTVLSRFSELDPMVSESLLELGNQLGQFDISGQVRGLENCRGHCISMLDQLTTNKDSRLRSYQTLGLCAGAAIVILFI